MKKHPIGNDKIMDSDSVCTISFTVAFILDERYHWDIGNLTTEVCKKKSVLLNINTYQQNFPSFVLCRGKKNLKKAVVKS